MEDFIRIRLNSHYLTKHKFATPAEVIEHYGCIQAQDIQQASRAIASRTVDASWESIRQACRDKTIVRTRPMRGTLHYLAPKYVHLMLDICAAKTLPGFAKRREFLDIKPEHAELALKLMKSALKGGKALTRKEIGKVLLQGGIPLQTQRVYHLICYAATRKLICFGPPQEKEETFVLLDERIPEKNNLTIDESYAELARMYIRSHGPCTADDLARRCGLGKGICKKAIESIEHEFGHFEYEGKHYYYLLQKESDDGKEGDIRLLGGFDEYFLGYKDRSIVADIQHHGKLFTTNGIFFPLIMLDGKIIGTRKRKIKKNTVYIDIRIIENDIDIDENKLDKQARKYADYLGVKEVIVNREE